MELCGGAFGRVAESSTVNLDKLTCNKRGDIYVKKEKQIIGHWKVRLANLLDQGQTKVSPYHKWP
jgi:hypothetical protein